MTKTMPPKPKKIVIYTCPTCGTHHELDPIFGPFCQLVCMNYFIFSIETVGKPKEQLTLRRSEA